MRDHDEEFASEELLQVWLTEAVIEWTEHSLSLALGQLGSVTPKRIQRLCSPGNFHRSRVLSDGGVIRNSSSAIRIKDYQETGRLPMARTKGSKDIVGWQLHTILRELALNEKRPELIAEEQEIPVDTVYKLRWRNKAKIAAILADWSNEFSDQWAAKKHARTADILYLADELQARIDEIKADAEAATEVMKRVDPTAAPVRIDTRELRGLIRDKAKLLHQYAHEMGQLPEHVAAIAGSGYGMSTRRALLGFTGPSKKDPVPVAGPESEPEESEPFRLGVRCRLLQG
jgi:hypothetical protein